jgi:hypothetical protein
MEDIVRKEKNFTNKRVTESFDLMKSIECGKIRKKKRRRYCKGKRVKVKSRNEILSIKRKDRVMKGPASLKKRGFNGKKVKVLSVMVRNATRKNEPLATSPRMNFVKVEAEKAFLPTKELKSQGLKPKIVERQHPNTELPFANLNTTVMRRKLLQSMIRCWEKVALKQIVERRSIRKVIPPKTAFVNL